MSKISKTFSIDDKIYQKFEYICKSKQINKSKVIQDSIKKFIGENYYIDFTINYNLRFGENTETVKITKKENEFIFLDNGNKINIFDFETLYIPEKNPDVKEVLKELKSPKIADIDETISPDILNEPLLDIDKAEELKENFFNKKLNYKKLENNENIFIEDIRTEEDKKQDLLKKWKEESEKKKLNQLINH